MTRPDKAHSSFQESLTVTLQGVDLQHLRDYREAEHALTLAHWPEEVKQGNAPDKYREHYQRQKITAADALAQVLSEQVDGQLAPLPTHPSGGCA